MSNEIGKRIKTARKIRGLSQERLSKEVGINHQTLRSYEKEDNSKLDIIKKISDSLDVPLELLVNGIDNRFKDDYSFEDLIKNPEMYYQDYLPQLIREDEYDEIEETENKIDIFNEMINFIEEMALSHNDEKFDVLYKTVQLLIKEEILKQRQENNKKNIFLNYIDHKLNPKYSITFNGKTLGLSEKEKKQLKNILPSLKSIFDI